MAVGMVGSKLSIIQCKSGTSYTSDATGFYSSVALGDVLDMLNAGAALQTVRSNMVATTDPGVSNDGTQGYGIGSIWMNTTSGLRWIAVSVGTGAAVWMPEQVRFLGRILGANMNSTADQAFVMFAPAGAKFRLTKITAQNASTSLTTAVGGVYNAASKGGTAAVANSQVYSALTAATKAVDLTLANTDVQAAATIMYLSLTTAQGGAATADLYMYGDIYI